MVSENRGFVRFRGSRPNHARHEEPAEPPYTAVVTGTLGANMESERAGSGEGNRENSPVNDENLRESADNDGMRA